MIDLEDYKKFILEFIPDLKDNELYNSLNHVKNLDNGLSLLNIRGLQFYYTTYTHELDHMNYGCNPPRDVGLYLFKNKELDEKIIETGYDFK